jgi:hypothetical protein
MYVLDRDSERLGSREEVGALPPFLDWIHVE